MAKPKKVVIKKSNKSGKKLMAVFEMDSGRSKTTHFGSAGMDDYTKTRDKDQRSRYLKRHRRNENWNAPTSAGALSRWILWGDSTSRATNISSFKRRFNL
mgnify:CR=1 FL=1|tara:strand:- start:901 stop:1200 length:300 start_codon:yes stop_codon:yes gene_type:complete